MAGGPWRTSTRFRQRLSSLYASDTARGSRLFQASSAKRTFCAAVSAVKGGRGGRDIRVPPGHPSAAPCTCRSGATVEPSERFLNRARACLAHDGALPLERNHHPVQDASPTSGGSKRRHPPKSHHRAERPAAVTV